MIYAVHQPHYLPYPGYLGKIALAGRFVFLEGVQYVRREFQNRNRIKGPNGAQWLTVPVNAEYQARISEVGLDHSTDWRFKHLETLRRFYAHAPAADFLEDFEQVLDQEFETLADLATATTQFFSEVFSIPTPLQFQEDFEPLPTEPTQRIIQIGRELGADVYLAGQGGKNYMDLDAFRAAGIEVRFLDYHLDPYSQLYGEFIPHLAALDLLLNEGPEGFDRYVRVSFENP